MLLWLEHSDESELDEILEVIREVEEEARADFEAARTRLNSERALGNLGPADGSQWRGRMREAVLSELAVICGQRVKQLKRLQSKVKNDGRELHSEAAADGDG